MRVWGKNLLHHNYNLEISIACVYTYTLLVLFNSSMWNKSPFPIDFCYERCPKVIPNSFKHVNVNLFEFSNHTP